jgi:ribosome maturation factor RimP
VLVATIEEFAAQVATSADLVLYDVERHGGSITVLLDRPGGIDVEALAAASRELSRLLDDAGLISDSTTLEVSSPGLERRLRTAVHFEGAIGDRVRVKTRVEVDGERRHDGVLRGIDGDVVTVVTDAGDERTIELDQIDRATTVFEWGSSTTSNRAASAPSGSSTPKQRPATPRNSEATT